MRLFRSKSASRALWFGLFITTLLSTTLPTISDAATVLFITRGNGTFNSDELERTSLITSWGHTILPLYQNSTQTVFDAAVAQADVAYFSSQINTSQIGFDPVTTCVGSVIEEGALSDEFGLSSTSADFATPTLYLVGSSHYITATLPGGATTIFSPAERLHHLSGTIAPGALTLALDGTTNNDIVMAVVDIGDMLYTGVPATGRRVWLPWGPTNITFSNITANGETLMKRSIEWTSQANTCSRMTKRAFLTDGTPIADGSGLPIGTQVDFLLYINNSGGIKNDVRVQDILDPTFLYQPGTLRVDNSQAQCVLSPCPTAEEAAILAAVKAGTVVSDLSDGDVASISGSTITAGGVTNGQLDITANRIWAIRFTVQIQP